jgi:hypothetical protein
MFQSPSTGSLFHEGIQVVMGGLGSPDTFEVLLEQIVQELNLNST